MRRTNLRGHALRAEGGAFLPSDEQPWVRHLSNIGYGLCECGATTSAMEYTDAARKRWHAAHKAEVTTASLPKRQED